MDEILSINSKLNMNEIHNHLNQHILSMYIINKTFEKTNKNKNKNSFDFTIDNIFPNSSHNNIAFGSVFYGWAFTLNTFASMYSCKFALSSKKMLKKLWGNNYWNKKPKKWVKLFDSNNGIIISSDHCVRGFDEFILKPIKILHNAIMNKQKDIYDPIINALNLTFTVKEKELLNGKNEEDILRLIMSKWLPINDVLLNMITSYLPSPITSQVYKCKNMYYGSWCSEDEYAVIALKRYLNNYRFGELLFCYDIIKLYLSESVKYNQTNDKEAAISMSLCDPKGPLIMYISKRMPSISSVKPNKSIAFGRVFSGNIKKGQEIRIMGANFTFGKKRDLFIENVEKILLFNGINMVETNECPAGNLCGIVGNNYISAQSTISNATNVYPFRKISISPIPLVLKVYIELKNASDLPQLVDGLKMVAKLNDIRCETTRFGTQYIRVSNEFTLKKSLNDLNKYSNNIQISTKLIPSFRETITSCTGDDPKYPKICVGKSPNKHNRVYMRAEPLSNKFVQNVENGELKLVPSEMKAFGRKLATEYDWEYLDARKIWTFGCPQDATANCVVDVTRGVQFLNEIKDHFVGGFYQASKWGVLCNEPMRGIRFNITDVRLFADSMHRGAGQVMPASKKAFYACQIASTPKLLEPMYLIDIITSRDKHLSIFSILNAKRAEIEKIKDLCVATSLSNIQAYIPISESFGLDNLLKDKTTTVDMKFSHWKLIAGDPLKADSPSNKILLDVRKQKGLKLQPPNFNDWNDRL